MNSANCRSSTVNLITKENFIFAQPEPVYIYTDINKPNFIGDSYMRLQTSLQFPSNTGYHIFDYTLNKLLEQSCIESISIPLFMKAGTCCLKIAKFHAR